MRRLFASLLILATGLAAQARAEGTKEVEDCLRKNAPSDSSVQTILLKAHDSSGGVRELRATSWWKRSPDGFSRIRMLFSEPADMRGAGVLLIEKADRNDMFVYLPELKKVRRITGQMMSGNLFGTDLNYEQLERLQGVAKDTGVERLPDGKLDGRDVYVVQSKPAGEGSEFVRIVAQIDKAMCVPIKIEFYGTGAEPQRVVTVDTSKISKQGNIYVPSYVLAKDLQASTETELIVENMEMGKPLQEKNFSEAALISEGR
jgi:hypothetical protein